MVPCPRRGHGTPIIGDGEVLRRMTGDEVSELGSIFGMKLGIEESEELAGLAAELMLTLDELGYGPRPPEVVSAERVDLGRPGPEADPFNAVVRRCSVKAAMEGALSGRRIAVKDTIAVAGVPLTAGSRVLQGFIPNTDAMVVERMLRAGAEIVALTNTDYLALSGGGDTSFYGPMMNPFDRTRTTGGSSGGSGAILHYDWADIALGGDQGGSIRVPAAWCGVIGLKPTHSLVPYTGIVGLDPTIDHVGPMGRTAGDVALLLSVIAGADSSDPRQYEVTTEDYVRRVSDAPSDLSGMRIAILEEGTDEALAPDPAVVAAFEAAVESLRRLGATIDVVSIPEHLTSGAIGFATFLEGMSATAQSGGNGYGWSGRYWPEFAAALRSGLLSHADQLSPQSKIMFILGTYMQRQYGGSLYAQAQNRRPGLRQAYDQILSDHDVIIMPTTPGLPHPIDPEQSMVDFVLRGWGVLGNTSAANLTGHPAISLPLGRAGNLPVGLMAMGRRFDDGLLLQLASTCEREIGWFSGELDLPTGLAG